MLVPLGTSPEAAPRDLSPGSPVLAHTKNPVHDVRFPILVATLAREDSESADLPGHLEIDRNPVGKFTSVRPERVPVGANIAIEGLFGDVQGRWFA